MTPTPFVRPMVDPQFAPFNIKPPRNVLARSKPPRNVSARSKPVENSANLKEMNASVDDLNEVRSKRFVNGRTLTGRLLMIYLGLFTDRVAYFLNFSWDCA
jgi:hypothetical protein